jgi:ribosomal protein S14
MKHKDKIIRSQVKAFETKRLILKGLNKYFYKTNQIGLQSYSTLKLNSFPKRTSKTQVRNRCAITNRSNGVLKHFRISRICLRELASAGLLPGVTKSSW